MKVYEIMSRVVVGRGETDPLHPAEPGRREGGGKPDIRRGTA